MPVSDRAALFVRVPTELMEAVDARVRATGRTKQALVTGLIESGLVESGLRVEPALPHERSGPGIDPAADVVCDLDEIAALLRVDPDDVVARVANDDLPGRNIGGQWRFSRAAVMRWLEGADRPDRAPTGFAP